ncbi:hypothetical protein HHK36_020888 [Tetracentron sinense]|uniref:Gnk2-homologous domain-containing protein n=1 Tax=Tetracentron sinense TaxID=13715 RepID=A0A834Z0N1_TETSI|nr:hypothetical protein HHK36_020888 [Tetracentron sinense]
MVLTFLTFTHLLVTLLSFTTTTTTGLSELRRNCSTTQATNPEPFDVNFVDAMEIISQQIADTGFGFAVSGYNTPDRVYGLGQCFNYLSSIDCRLCYAESRVKLPLCLPATAAQVYLDGCFLRYGDYNFSQEIFDDLDTYICGSSSKNIDDKILFKEITNGLIRNLTLEAYEDRDYYKEGNVTVSLGVSVYGIAQCWRSVNKSGCKECLEIASQNIVNCLPGSAGRALNSGCFVRYSTEPFYVEASQLKSSSSSSVLRRRLGAALGSIFAAVVVIGGAILWRMRVSSRGTDYRNMDGSLEIPRHISESRLSFKYDDMRRATNDFDIGKQIGQGGHGSVYKIWGHFTSNSLIEMLDPYLRGQCSEEQVQKVFHVGLLCTQASSSLRPPMWKVVEMLTSTARDLPLPTKPPFIDIKGVEVGSSGSETPNTSGSKSHVSVNQMSVSILMGR